MHFFAHPILSIDFNFPLLFPQSNPSPFWVSFSWAYILTRGLWTFRCVSPSRSSFRKTHLHYLPALWSIDHLWLLIGRFVLIRLVILSWFSPITGAIRCHFRVFNLLVPCFWFVILRASYWLHLTRMEEFLRNLWLRDLSKYHEFKATKILIRNSSEMAPK